MNTPAPGIIPPVTQAQLDAKHRKHLGDMVTSVILTVIMLGFGLFLSGWPLWVTILATVATFFVGFTFLRNVGNGPVSNNNVGGTPSPASLTSAPTVTEPKDNGKGLRLLICFGSTFAVGFVAWAFLNHTLYIPFNMHGGQWFWNTLVAIGVAHWFYYCFDNTTIQLNFKGEILYFGKSAFSDVDNGFVCLGLPKCFVTIKPVDFKKLNVTVGLMKGDKREEFVVECNGFRAIFDIAFEVKPNSTKKILELGGNIEKRLVTEVNAVLYEIANSFVKDPVTGNDTSEKMFPTIESLKAATGLISKAVMADNSPTGPRARLNNIGYTLCSVTLKDVENEDRSIINANQSRAARVLREKEELLSVVNMPRKVKALRDRLAKLLKKGEILPSIEECQKMIEREEGRRTVYEGLQGARPIIGIPGPGNNNGGKKGGGNRKSNP